MVCKLTDNKIDKRIAGVSFLARGYYREKEHAFTAIERDLRENKVPCVVLLCGSEDYLIEWYKDALVKRYVSDAVRSIDLTVIEGENLSFENIRDSAETLSIMSERKVVLIPDFLPAEGKSVKGFRDSDIDRFAEYISEMPQGSMIIMTAREQEDSRRRKNKIKAAVEKYGKVYDFQQLSEKQLRGFIEKRLKVSGRSFHPSLTDMIISESGYGNKAVEYRLYNLDNDLKKIIAHSRGDSIKESDVRAVMSASPENDVFAMLDAIGRNRKDEALLLLHNLLDSGTPAFNLLRLITGQLELMLEVKEMKEEGMGPEEMQKTLGAHQFRIKKALSASGKYQLKTLKKILCEAYEVDGNIKTVLFDDSLALEYFVAKL